MNTYPIGKSTSGTTNVTYSNATIEEQLNVFQGVNLSAGYNNYAVTLKASPSQNYTFTLPPIPGTVNQILITNGAGTTSWVSPGTVGIGTVTSVAMTVPSILSVSGSPITSSGIF